MYGLQTLGDYSTIPLCKTGQKHLQRYNSVFLLYSQLDFLNKLNQLKKKNSL